MKSEKNPNMYVYYIFQIYINDNLLKIIIHFAEKIKKPLNHTFI